MFAAANTDLQRQPCTLQWEILAAWTLELCQKLPIININSLFPSLVPLPPSVHLLSLIFYLLIQPLYGQTLFSKAFKQAKFIPIYKSGNRKDPSNYRPISVLSVISKPLEKLINSHLLSHLKTNELLHPNPSESTGHHSCHTPLTTLVDKWHTTISNNDFTGVLLCILLRHLMFLITTSFCEFKIHHFHSSCLQIFGCPSAQIKTGIWLRYNNASNSNRLRTFNSKSQFLYKSK